MFKQHSPFDLLNVNHQIPPRIVRRGIDFFHQINPSIRIPTAAQKPQQRFVRRQMIDQITNMLADCRKNGMIGGFVIPVFAIRKIPFPPVHDGMPKIEGDCYIWLGRGSLNELMAFLQAIMPKPKSSQNRLSVFG